ncbi:DUF6077 domain-containing protein [Microcoleus sp. A003_D6]
MLIFSHHIIQKTKNLITEKRQYYYYSNKKIRKVSAFLLIASLPIMSWSWAAFWATSSAALLLCIFYRKIEDQTEIFSSKIKENKFSSAFVAFISLGAIILAYSVSRSDLDDSFYLAVASYTSSNPSTALISIDPMLGESNYPLIFPSYRFSSFELLSGAVAHLFSVPAMDAYYIYLLPFWVIAAVAANFLLAKEFIPKHWLLAGTLALLLTLLLGEMHRSPANFSFVRIFQGKAVFLSVIVPTIFYLTHRFFSERGTSTDLLLIACCQVSSIGLTNFGMLMGPIAGFAAIVSNFPLAIRSNYKKIYYAAPSLLIPFPYLMDVAMESNGSPILNFESESASHVWVSVFGINQQYLLGFLILAGPVLAKDVVLRWRLAVPALIFFLIHINPFFSDFISKNITTPPVYWRITWSFPFVAFAAVSLCIIFSELLDKKLRSINIFVISVAVVLLIAYSIPFNTLRQKNIGEFDGFATWKIPSKHLLVSTRAMAFDNGGGRLLAPDDIAGVISRFENHPKLISSRGLYLDLMRPFIREDDYTRRKILHNFVTGSGEMRGEDVKAAIRTLDVSIIVLNFERENPSVLRILESQEFERRELVNNYTIWTRRI